MKFEILDLFCGASGFLLGMDENKNMETVVAVDFDKSAALTFILYIIKWTKKSIYVHIQNRDYYFNQ